MTTLEIIIAKIQDKLETKYPGRNPEFTLFHDGSSIVEIDSSKGLLSSRTSEDVSSSFEELENFLKS